jgi:cytochrome d ubiquinol oxidase subunit II
MATYALLGACWLVIKTEGELQRRLHLLITPLTALLLLFMIAVSVWTPLSDPRIAERWFEAGMLSRLLPVPLLVAVGAWFMFSAARKRLHVMPFILALALVLLGYIGLLVSVWPYAIPYSLTLVDAAAPRASQTFALAGALVVLPVILVYTTAGYWVFRGKLVPGTKYD